MSRELTKMNLIAIVQQLPKDDIEVIQTYISMIEQENNQLKENNRAMQEEMARTWKKLDVIKELRSWLEEDNNKIDVLDAKDNSSVKLGIMIGLGMCLDKLNELEGGKNE